MTPEETRLFQKRDYVMSLVQRIVSASKEAIPALQEELCSLVLFGVYEHFESTKPAQKTYSVLGLGFDPGDSSRYMVVHYFNGPRPTPLMVSPLAGKEGFFEPAEDPNNKGRFLPRFKLLKTRSVTREQSLQKMGMKIYLPPSKFKVKD